MISRLAVRASCSKLTTFAASSHISLREIEPVDDFIAVVRVSFKPRKIGRFLRLSTVSFLIIFSLTNFLENQSKIAGRIRKTIL